jgi:hypothetical protein
LTKKEEVHLNNELKAKIAETANSLIQSVEAEDICLLFQYESELAGLIGEEKTMQLLEKLSQSGSGAAQGYLQKTFEEAKEKEVKSNA